MAEGKEFTRDVLGRFGRFDWSHQVRLGLVDYEGKLLIAKNDEL